MLRYPGAQTKIRKWGIDWDTDCGTVWDGDTVIGKAHTIMAYKTVWDTAWNTFWDRDI